MAELVGNLSLMNVDPAASVGAGKVGELLSVGTQHIGTVLSLGKGSGATGDSQSSGMPLTGQQGCGRYSLLWYLSTVLPNCIRSHKRGLKKKTINFKMQSEFVRSGELRPRSLHCGDLRR